MINISVGRYWDEGIKLVSSCTPCSPGCDHCWSLAMEKRFNGNHKTIGKGIWLHPDRLKRFNTRKSKVFACWNDLFHEAVPDKFIHQVIAHARVFDNNQYLFLTKRSKRMSQIMQQYKKVYMSHLHFGLTVCNQQEADEKIPIFLQVPGKKFISHEPALEQINYGDGLKEIDVLISGAETGAGARITYPDTFRTDRAQCELYGVNFFLKYSNKRDGRLLDGKFHDALPWVTK